MSSAADGIAEALARKAEERKRWTVRGEWDNEPDREAFEHLGLPCVVQRGGSGGWCGYVAVPPGHPLHGKGYSGTYDEDMNYTGSPVSDLDVHGGITYAEKCQGGICHVPKPGEPDDVWWLGFDCAHSGDITPVSAGYGLNEWHASYKTIDYVKRETLRLAEQLANPKKAEAEDV